MKFLSIATAAALLVMSGASFAQSTQPGSAGAATSRCDALTGTEKERCLREEGSAGATTDPAPSAAPSATPSANPAPAPGTIPYPATNVGGLSKCENLIGMDKDKCLQEERGGTASTSGRAAGAGGSHAPGSTGTGAGTMGPQNTAPSGSVR